MKKTPSRHSPLVLSTGRIWLYSLPFRWVARSSVPGFAPGLRNVLAYEKARLWGRLYERDRLMYRWLQLKAWLGRKA